MQEKDWKRLTTLVIVVVLVYLAVTHLEGLSNIISTLLSVISPFLTGLALAFIINLPVRFIEKYLIRFNKGEWKGYFRAISITLSLVILLLIVTFVLFLVIPDLEETIQGFIISVPAAFNQVYSWITEFLDNHPDLIQIVSEANVDWSEIQSNVIGYARNILTGLINSVANWIPGLINSVVDFFIALVFAVSLVGAKEIMKRQAKKLNYGIFSYRWASFFENLAQTADRIFSTYIGGQAFEAVLTGIMVYILMSIFQFPYSLSISVITGLSTFIPVYGAIIGGIIGFILIAATDFVKGLWFVVLIVIVQQIEGNILYPRVMGSQIGIPSIWILVVVTIGGSLFGFVGMLLAVPVFSIIYQIVSENINYRLDKKNITIKKKDDHKSIAKAKIKS